MEWLIGFSFLSFCGFCVWALCYEIRAWKKIAESRGRELDKIIEMHVRYKKAKELQLCDLYGKLRDAGKNDHRDEKGRFKKAP